MKKNTPITNSANESAELPYAVLPNGKMQFTRATRVDIVVSLLLPFVGLMIAHYAFKKGEKRRSGEMIRASVVSLLAIHFLCFVL